MRDFISTINFVVVLAGLYILGLMVLEHQDSQEEAMLEVQRVIAVKEMTAAGIEPFGAQCALKFNTTKICEQYLRQQGE